MIPSGSGGTSGPRRSTVHADVIATARHMEPADAAHAHHAPRASPCTAAPLSRRGFLANSAAMLSLLVARRAGGEQSRVPFIAWLSAMPNSDRLSKVFRSALVELGYVEGQSIRVEAHSAPAGAELRAVARELVGRQADIIVANGRAATRAAQEASADIPIVMAPVDDPYEFVASLSHPGANITGLSLQQTEIDAKQIEFLKTIVPTISRLAIFHYYGETYYALDAIAHELDIQTIWIEIKGSNDVDKAFAEARANQADGLLVINTDILGAVCNSIADKAITRHLPAAGSWRDGGDSRLLLTYSADDKDLQNRVAAYVHRLLSGAKAQDLPIEQATKFDLRVSLVVARTIGVTVPSSMLVRADHVIE